MMVERLFFSFLLFFLRSGQVRMSAEPNAFDASVDLSRCLYFYTLCVTLIYEICSEMNTQKKKGEKKQR